MAESEQQFIARGFGKWSQRGVPHKGWTCIGIDDLEDDRATCEMCETAEVRYVHTMTHPAFEGELEVGCVCAGNMEQDLVRAEVREKEFKRRQNPRVAVALTWFEAAKEILANAGDLSEMGVGLWPYSKKCKLSSLDYDLVRDVLYLADWCTRPRARKKFFLHAYQISDFRQIYQRVLGKDHDYIAILEARTKKREAKLIAEAEERDRKERAEFEAMC